MTADKVDAVPLDYDKSPYHKQSAVAVSDNSRFVRNRKSRNQYLLGRSPKCLLFFAAQGRQFGRTIWKKYPEQKKNHESITRNIQHEEQQKFGDEVVRVLPRNPFEEPLEEHLHQVYAGIRQIGNRPADPGSSQHEPEKREENAAENGMPDELATHVVSISSNEPRNFACRLILLLNRHISR